MDYEGAICALNTLQHDASVIAQMRCHQKDPELRLQSMLRYLHQTGLTVEELDKLNIIHVTGTKGKGSTCAFTERILRNHGFRTGFFSSPHLVQLRERIRINGQPISKELFAKYFWEIYEQLDDAKKVEGGSMPEAFQIFALMAFHIFLQERVDVAIIEVGLGGAYDSTNIIRKPWVCGISSLGIDHIGSLGNTIEKIAWHKAGIFKPGVLAFTVSQPPIPLRVLQDRAEEIGCPLFVCPELEEYEATTGPLHLGLTGQQQRLNASLALQLSYSWLQHKEEEGESGGLYSAPALDHKLGFKAAAFQPSSKMLTGLRETQWLGRNQTVRHGPMTYYLDGAHTTESMQGCVEWFTEKALNGNEGLKDPGIRVLLFNTTGERDSNTLLKLLVPGQFQYAVFCPNLPESAPVRVRFCGCGEPASLEVTLGRCLNNQSIWQTLNGAETHTQVFPSILSALQWISQGRDPVLASGDPQNYQIPLQPSDGTKALKEAAHISVLVTGSVYLIGGVLEHLDPSLVS